MKTLTLNAENPDVFRRTNKLLLTVSMLISVTAGWCLGSFTTLSGTQKSNYQNEATILSIPMKGEALPTIILKEFSVIANKNI